MVGTQQVGEDAMLSRIGYGFAAVSILMLIRLLIKERPVTRCTNPLKKLLSKTTQTQSSSNHDLFSSLSLLIM
jgi:hypothetical protein